MKECIFCEYAQNNNIILENNLAFAIFDTFPVNEGHMLIIPKRHFPSYFEANLDEILAIHELVHQAKNRLDSIYRPDGYNIGINVGKDAGQTIFHLHVHVIPRYKGDVKNPKGGVRNIKKPLVEYEG